MLLWNVFLCCTLSTAAIEATPGTCIITALFRNLQNNGQSPPLPMIFSHWLPGVAHSAPTNHTSSLIIMMQNPPY